jgi:nitroreductase
MLEAIRNRRSVRFYRDDPVSDADIEEVLKIAGRPRALRVLECAVIRRFGVLRDPQLSHAP